MRLRAGWTLFQMMACCLTVPSRYLKQRWCMISGVQWQLLEGNSTKRGESPFIKINMEFSNLKFHSNFQFETAYTLAANVMESLLINGICVNLIGIYCFWSYVQLRNEILLILSIHYVIKLNGQTQSVLSGDRLDSREGKSEFRGSHLKWSLPSHYQFHAFMRCGVSVKTIDISLNF